MWRECRDLLREIRDLLKAQQEVQVIVVGSQPPKATKEQQEEVGRTVAEHIRRVRNWHKKDRSVVGWYDLMIPDSEINPKDPQ